MTNRLTYLWSLLRAAARHGETSTANKEALVECVLAAAAPGDIDEAIRAIDEFSRHTTWLMNVGDEKGQLLDDAVRRARPRRLLELGAFCGYSGLRMARNMIGGAQLRSVEISPVNAAMATRVWQHAGVTDRVQAVVGTLSDGTTLDRLRTELGSIDFVFVDHAQSRYLPDLLILLDAGLLHPGTVVLADNVKVPGAPRYLSYLRQHEGRSWRSVEHKTVVEYQSLIPDLVVESTYLGAPTLS